jgi:hypothetical protein
MDCLFSGVGGSGLFACLWYSYRSIRGLLRVRHVNGILLHLTDE